MGIKSIIGTAGDYAQLWLDSFKLYERETNEMGSQKDEESLYQKKRSFTNLLPYCEYLNDPKEDCFLFDDVYSVAAVCDIIPANSEGVQLHELANIRDNFQTFLKDTFPQEEKNPWVVEFFQSDVLSLNYFTKTLRNYVNNAKVEGDSNPLAEAYLPVMEQHLNDVCQSGGLFLDDTVTGQQWRGSIRVYRMVYYRKYTGKNKPSGGRTPIEELNEIRQKVESNFEQYGILTSRVKGAEFFEWMVRWFNPKPAITDGNVDALIEAMAYSDENLPYGHDLAENMMVSLPESDAETGIWHFDGMPHKVISVLNVRNAPEIGALSAPKQKGKQISSTFDKMPEGTVMCLRVVIEPTDITDEKIEKVGDKQTGMAPKQMRAKRDVQIAREKIASGDPMFPCEISFFIRGEDKKQLRKNSVNVLSILQGVGLNAIDEDKDLVMLDSYIRNLPMAYDPSKDKNRRRSRFIFSQQIANLLPIFGRGRGSGHPGIVFFNRGGEPMCFDPLNPDDRAKNGHLLLFGPTGSGKSAQIVGILLFIMTVYNARVFLVEAGNSFEGLREYIKSSGSSTHHVRMTMDDPTTLPPFANAIKALEFEENQANERPEQYDVIAEVHKEFKKAQIEPESDDDSFDEDEEEAPETKDYLGEMEIIARIMVSGGKKEKADQVSLGDQQLIREGILNAARFVREHKLGMVLTEHVVSQLEAVSTFENVPQSVKERFYEYANAMKKFTQGLTGAKFNRKGELWPDVDFTHIDLAKFVQDGYEAELAVSYMSIMNHVNDVAERDQFGHRPIIFLTDESHIITKNALLAPGVVKIVKMWRKLGAWLWMATQNMKDFPDEAEVMLSLFEWWLCLNLEADEVKEIARFKDLTPEMQHLLKSTRKQNGAFTEGVVMSSKINELFRAVPPSFTLVLAWSEKHEKKKIKDRMREQSLNRVEASWSLARDIDKGRGIRRAA
ncbi:conjugative transfer ATPase [Vibrio fluvialis]|uniref:conjugative transfer ATPase n=1 Tax=Vibrio fluvialis TaxID=676 RepID=UPI00192C0661|nr:conjugative transfer ATPase [Vibrio fluvialis]MBL4262819.1 conjugative transfer ATPase [Vibrio fluvialis]